MPVPPPAPSVKPICPFFSVCGGCDLQDVAYSDQVRYKDQNLRELFRVLPGSENLWQPFIASPDEYPIFFRNKLRFGFVMQDGKVMPSRHAKGSETADIAVDRCFLQSETSNACINAVARFAHDYHWEIYNPITHTGWLKHVLIRQTKYRGDMLISLVTDNAPIKEQEEWVEAMRRQVPEIVGIYQTLTWGKNNEHARDVHLWGETTITEKVGGYVFRISPHAFFQTNSAMVETLYEAIKKQAALKKGECLWDLYAGSATIGIYLSGEAGRVVSIEPNSQNIEDAQSNLQLNQIGNVEVVQGTVEEILTSEFLKAHSSPDVIVVDPPRAGLSAQLKRILPHLPSHRLVYVSCNPETCLRDCEELTRHHYRLESLQGIDMFPHTYHCEMIATLVKQRA